MKKTSAIVISMMAIGGLAFGQDAPKGDSAKNKPSHTIVMGHAGSYLGVGAIDIDEDRAKALKLKDAQGVEIKSVEDGSPAAKAGLKEGDVVLEYNGQQVEGSEQFARLVHETPSGRQVKLSIWRNGASQTLTATIGKRSGGYYMHSGDDGFTMTMPPMPAMPPMPPMPAMPPAVQERMQEMAARHTVLGVETESLTPQLAEFFGVKDGVLVRSVIKNSPAEKAGIKAGDVIVKVDDTKVTNPHELTAVLQPLRSKKTFPVTVVRKQQETTLTVTVEDRRGMRGPESMASGVLYC